MFLDIKRTDVFNRLGIVFCVFIFGMFFICLEIKIFVFYREKKYILVIIIYIIIIIFFVSISIFI